MNRTLHRLIIVAAIMITSLGVTASPAQAGGKSGWGWSKPINKRLGAFYTSNRNSNLGSSKHIKRSSAQPIQRSHAGVPHSPTVRAAPPAIPASPVAQPHIVATVPVHASTVHASTVHQNGSLPLAPVPAQPTVSQPQPSQPPSTSATPSSMPMGLENWLPQSIPSAR